MAAATGAELVRTAPDSVRASNSRRDDEDDQAELSDAFHTSRLANLAKASSK